ncbi:MAG: hypothetical protein U1D30_05085 [Planctomycetota bacterium]
MPPTVRTCGGKAAADRPDLILMEILLPGVDGAEATRQIMTNSPCAVLIVTSSIAGQANKVYQSLGFGALDSVQTPCFGPDGRIHGANDLLAKSGDHRANRGAV